MKISSQYQPFLMSFWQFPQIYNKKVPNKKKSPKVIFFLNPIITFSSNLMSDSLMSDQRFKGDGDNLEFKKFSERRGGSEPDGKPRFRALEDGLK